MIDLGKAEALLRSDGMSPFRPSVASVRAYVSESLLAEVVVRRNAARVEPRCGDFGELSPDDTTDLIDDLTRAAALCRRIEAECQASQP